jgi:glycosyltransferase involved in cell wall biosynthesis
MTSVSVVVPCYNYGRYVGEAVRSVLDDQPGIDLRILIIDDASSDGSDQIVKEVAASDPRVEARFHRVNMGNVATYNEGVIDWADGEYTVLLSADDRLTPGSLRRSVDLMGAHPSAGFVYGHPIHYRDGDTPQPARTRVRGWSVWPGKWWLERRFRDAHSVITSPEVLIRTSLLKRVGGFSARLEQSNDTEMWMRLAAHADVGHVRGVDQAYYRVHPGSMSARRPILIDLWERRRAYELAIEEYGDRLPNIVQLSDIVHCKLSREAIWAAARAYDRRRTGEVPVNGLTEFAIDCWPGMARMPIYHALRLRQRIGPRTMPYLQPFALSAAPRRVQNWWWWRSWARRGLLAQQRRARTSRGPPPPAVCGSPLRQMGGALSPGTHVHFIESRDVGICLMPRINSPGLPLTSTIPYSFLNGHSRKAEPA